METAVKPTGDELESSSLARTVILIGFIILVLGPVAALIHQQDLAAYTAHATGTVVGYQSNCWSRYRYPVIEFAAADGSTRQFTACGPLVIPADQPVKIAYDPADATRAMVETPLDGAYMVFLLAGVGVITILVGLWASKN